MMKEPSFNVEEKTDAENNYAAPTQLEQNWEGLTNNHQRKNLSISKKNT